MNRRRLPTEHPAKRGSLARRVFVGLGRLVVAFGLAAAVVFGAVTGWKALLNGGRFSVRNVAFIGNERAATSELSSLAGALDGRNIFMVDLAAAAHRLEKHPWVAHARVARDLPDTLRVTIEERTAKALVSAGSLYVVDGEGLAFKTAAASDRLDLPVISGLTRDGLTSPDGSPSPSLLTALRLIRTYDERNLSARAPLSEVVIGQEAGELAYTLYAGDDAMEIKLGVLDDNVKDIPGVFDRLERVWAKLDELAKQGTRTRSIDLGNRLRQDWVPARLQASADNSRFQQEPHHLASESPQH